MVPNANLNPKLQGLLWVGPVCQAEIVTPSCIVSDGFFFKAIAQLFKDMVFE